jgi:hypothetical protein
MSKPDHLLKYSSNIGFEVAATVTMMSSIFWEEMLCSLVEAQ